MILQFSSFGIFKILMISHSNLLMKTLPQTVDLGIYICSLILEKIDLNLIGSLRILGLIVRNHIEVK
jgi:hypothetical protein